MQDELVKCDLCVEGINLSLSCSNIDLEHICDTTLEGEANGLDTLQRFYFGRYFCDNIACT